MKLQLSRAQNGFRRAYDLSRCGLIVRNRRYAVAIAILLFFFLTRFNPFATTRLHRDELWGMPRLTSKADHQINNGTLGFGAIYVLGLPERSDKRDAMELAAALTGLQLTWFDGVKGDTMHPNAIPPAHTDQRRIEFKTDGALGCWRGHMNIIRDIVKRGLSSALIFEDDADWDVHIVEQMQLLSTATREVEEKTRQNNPWKHGPSKLRTGSPYGSDWDILWIGHCGGWPPNPRFAEYSAVIRGDKTVCPAFDMFDLRNDLETSNDSCSTHTGRDPKGRVCDSPRLAADERIVQLKASPICTTSYAVSQRGARKLLSSLSGAALVDVDANLDTEMTELCRGDRDGGDHEETRCLAVSPPLITFHRPRGSPNGDSDIDPKDGGERVVGHTPGVVWSTRMNADRLIAGLEPQSQYVVDGRTGEWRHKVKSDYGH